jgi:hypothetical protein
VTSFTVRQPAGPNRRFIEGCFDSSIGKEIPVAGQPGRLLSYEVVEGGTAVDLTFELDGEMPEEWQAAANRWDI